MPLCHQLFQHHLLLMLSRLQTQQLQFISTLSNKMSRALAENSSKKTNEKMKMCFLNVERLQADILPEPLLRSLLVKKGTRAKCKLMLWSVGRLNVLDDSFVRDPFKTKSFFIQRYFWSFTSIILLTMTCSWISWFSCTMHLCVCPTMCFNGALDRPPGKSRRRIRFSAS